MYVCKARIGQRQYGVLSDTTFVMLKSELKRVREFDVDVCSLEAKFNSHRPDTDNTTNPSSLLTTNDIIVNMQFQGDASTSLPYILYAPKPLMYAPPPNTLPGIGYLTYYADDKCEKNIALLRPFQSGELVHSAIIIILCLCVCPTHRYIFFMISFHKSTQHTNTSSLLLFL